MRALVTGADGFIARHFMSRLRGLDIDIARVGLSHKFDARDFFRYDDGKEHFDLVIHLAAVVGGRALIEQSALAHAANLEIDAALFQWAERVKPSRVVYFSSVAAYPARYQQFHYGSRLREEQLDWGVLRMPDELYGWAKLTGELLAERARAAGVKVTVVRPFGVYGPGQDVHTPFPGFLRQARAKADPIRVWGQGNQVRDFIHVSDVVEAVLLLTAQGCDEAVNLCSGRPTRLNQAARMFADAAGYSPDILGDETKAAGVEYRVGSPLRLHQYYIPQVSLEQGVKDMWERG